MIELIAFVLGVLITLPVLATILIYFISYKFYEKRQHAVHLAVNLTTLFYILAVGTMLHIIFGKSYFGIIFILLIIILGISVIVQWKVKGEIIFKYAWKGFWRFSFLIFVLAYFGLSIYGLIQRLIG